MELAGPCAELVAFHERYVVKVSLEEVKLPNGGVYVAEPAVKVELMYGAVALRPEPAADNEVCGS